jgi:Leucine-rich repeat (LRR) protein
LYLSGCNFIGSYPTLLPNLTQITSLDLSVNNFGGQIPWSLLNFESLTHLDLSYNNFIGQLLDPSSNKSSNSQLEVLILSNNLLNGTLPSWVYTIPSLRYLNLDYNQLTGYIGEFQHNALLTLSLSNNKLHGPLPMSISNLVRLRVLYISFNNLSGNVESKMFSNLKSLEYLDLSHNPLLSWNTFTNATNILPKLCVLHLLSSNLSEILHFLRTVEDLVYYTFQTTKSKAIFRRGY